MSMTLSPDSIRTALRDLGYRPTDWTPDDPDLAKIAAAGNSPELYPLRLAIGPVEMLCLFAWQRDRNFFPILRPLYSESF